MRSYLQGDQCSLLCLGMRRGLTTEQTKKTETLAVASTRRYHKAMRKMTAAKLNTAAPYT